MTDEEVMLEAEDRMEKAVEHTIHEFSTLHTGKASPGMVENVQVHVEAYGSTMTIKELGAVTTPDARTIQITPWDKSTLKAIEKGIQVANIGLNPSIDGTLIRLPVPELSGDRRKELVRMAHNMAEEGRISVRHARHFALDHLKKLQKSSDISEDDYHHLEKEVQKSTDKHIEAIDKALEAKEKDLLAV